MQVRHAQRRLLSRCTLRSYSVGAVPARKTVDPVATSDTPVSRLKRPLASTFGGINIQNVAVPSQKPRGGMSRFPRSGSSDDKSPDMRMRRTSQTDRFRGQGKAGSPPLSGWDDGLVSLSFSNRLKHHQNMTARGTGLPSEAQPRRQQSKQSEPTQRPQMHDHRRGQKEQRDASPNAHCRSPRAAKTNSAAAKYENQRSVTDAESEASSMTRHSASSFNLHARSRTTTTSAAKTPKAKAVLSKASKANPSSTSTSTSASSTQSTTTTTAAPSTADRSARLIALSSTNLNALFRTRDTPSAGVSLPLPSASPASMTTRMRRALERSAGDYSRFLPRRVGVRKNASRLPALRTARHALAVQRDVSLEQRRVALHIIGGLAQADRPQVRA